MSDKVGPIAYPARSWVSPCSAPYKHDGFGNRTSVLESSGDRVTWTYDPANQLLNEQRSGVNKSKVSGACQEPLFRCP
jgi:YD repeat-containing protein